MTDLADKLEALVSIMNRERMMLADLSWYWGEGLSATAQYFESAFEVHDQIPTIIRALRERDQAVELVKQAVDIFAHCTVEDGVCCCGDNMNNHPEPMSCGHSPVDQGSYIAGQWYDAARATLASIEGAEDEG